MHSLPWICIYVCITFPRASQGGERLHRICMYFDWSVLLASLINVRGGGGGPVRRAASSDRGSRAGRFIHLG